MTAKYSAFTFCDRIVEHVPAQSARGRFLVPSSVIFPPCLVAEATGQLAAWIAMAHIEFRGRPVAALAGATRYSGTVAPGETLELEVEIEHCDDETVAYGGRASVAGREILRLSDCVGPMLPQAEYDDPGDLAHEFERLCGVGATPGRFTGVPIVPLTPLQQDGGQWIARLDVPEQAPFFADHFPRRPVFPATLLLDGAMRAAGEFLRSSATANTTWQPVSMTNVKMRDFVLPGDSVVLTIDRHKASEDSAVLRLDAAIGDRKVATARMEFATTGVTI